MLNTYFPRLVPSIFIVETLHFDESESATLNFGPRVCKGKRYVFKAD